MKEFEKTFGFATWLGFFASRSSKPDLQSLAFIEPYIVLRTHVTALQAGAIEYLTSSEGNRLREFELNASRLGFAEVEGFGRELRKVFLPNEYPADEETRRAHFLRRLQNWNGESEPFPDLESKRALAINSLTAGIERQMLESPEIFLSGTYADDPFAGNPGIAKLRKRITSLK